MMEAFIGLVSYVYQVLADIQKGRHLYISPSQERVTSAWAELVDPAFTLRYLSDPRLQVAVDTVQQELRCCGLLIFSEWRDSAWSLASPSSLVPDSCCKTQSPGCGERDHPSNIPYTGCAHRRVNTDGRNSKGIS